MIKKLSTIIFILCLISAIGLCQQNQVYTLKQCIDVALENNLQIKRSIYNIETFRTNLTQAKANFLPVLNLGTSYSSNYGRAINPVTNLFVDRNSQALTPSISASMVLFNGLRIVNNYRQNRRDVFSADQDLQKAKNDLILNISNLYINVVFNNELLENAKFQLNSSQQQLERISKQVDVGALPLSFKLNQQAQVATNELNVINQENAINLSYLQLKQAMQVPASVYFEVEAPDLKIEDLVLENNPDQIFMIAKQNLPEIKSAVLKVESADMALKASRGSYYPRITIGASAQSNYSSLNNTARYKQDENFSLSQTPLGVTKPGDVPVYGYTPTYTQVSNNYGIIDQLSDNLFKSIGIQLNVPIFNNLQTRASVQRLRINKELASITVQETENTLRQKIEVAYNDALSASRTYNSSLKQVNAQQEAWRINKQRYEVGALSPQEYQVSENDLFRSKSDLTRAKYNFIFKKKIIDFYEGKSIEF